MFSPMQLYSHVLLLQVSLRQIEAAQAATTIVINQISRHHHGETLKL